MDLSSTHHTDGLPRVKNPPTSAVRLRRLRFDPCVRKIPWKRKWHPLSILAWRIPWTEEPGGLQPIEVQGVRELKLLSTHTHTMLAVNFALVVHHLLNPYCLQSAQHILKTLLNTFTTEPLILSL